MMWLWSSLASADNAYLPRQASTIAADVDAIYNFNLYVSIFFFVLLMAGMLFFVVRYRRRSDNDKVPYITHNYLLEFLWSFIPLVLMLGDFFWGWQVFKTAHTFPENGYQIDVRAKQWQWDFFYYDNSGPNGTRQEILHKTAELTVPAHTPVVLNMTSEDVIHSFFIPSFRLKQDVVPGKISKLWFQADEPGDYQVFCAQYCGLSHSRMMAKVHVIPQSLFQDFLHQKPLESMPLADQGKEHYVSKGCTACHSVDGSQRVGPSWKGIWAKPVSFEDGTSIPSIDEAYVRESILLPQAKIVKGYANAGLMPSYQGQLSEDELKALVEYIKSLQ
jgi:cytochrome c oxidase subunit 2